MKIALLSSTVFGYRCLEEGILPVRDVQLAGIVTTPRQIEISYSETPVTISTHADFADLANGANCEVACLKGKLTAESYLEHLNRWSPDLLLVLGWYYMIPKKVRDVARYGCMGIHASLLPKYRGGAPIPWVIINGEKETGVSLFCLEDGVDSGDIVAQVRFPITESDTCATVYEKATQASIDALKDSLPKIADGSATFTPQDESEATHFPQRKPEDGLIDWSWEPARIRNFIRAQTKPYPGAFTYMGDKKVIIWDADVIEAPSEMLTQS